MRALPRQLLVDEVHAVLAPEDLVADHEGRRAEHAAGEGGVGLGDQLLADLGAVGEGEEARVQELAGEIRRRMESIAKTGSNVT